MTSSRAPGIFFAMYSLGAMKGVSRSPTMISVGTPMAGNESITAPPSCASMPRAAWARPCAERWRRTASCISRLDVLRASSPHVSRSRARSWARWFQRAHERARDLETWGLDALKTSSREMQEAVRRHRSAQGLAHAARGMLAQEGGAVIDSLPAIGVPTLIIVGDRDTPFMAPSEYMAKKIPGARLEVIADAGHASNLDQPEAFNRVLLDFL